MPACKVEVLVPDFKGNAPDIQHIVDSNPVVFNHNVETVPRLYSEVRPQAQYKTSLYVLNYVAEKSSIPVKSGFMAGLGESMDEVFEMIDDLYRAGVRLLTIGQYLAPSEKHYPVKKYVLPEIFDEYKMYALNKGFFGVQSGPLVRSSYMADRMYDELLKSQEERTNHESQYYDKAFRAEK